MKITGILIYTPENKDDCLSIKCRLCFYSINNKPCMFSQWSRDYEIEHRKKADNPERTLKADTPKSKDYRIFGR